MSTASVASVTPRPAVRPQGLRAFVSDTLVLTRRNLLLSLRTPQLVVAAAIMPVMFVLLFRYVFGGSIHVAGYSNYVDYLIPGIIVQTSLFGGSSSAVGVAEDLSKGVTDRFRSLPTHRGAILTARTLADLVRLTYTVAVMISIGLLVGFTSTTPCCPSSAVSGSLCSSDMPSRGSSRSSACSYATSKRPRSRRPR
jgi:hypothetical protein